MFFDKEFDARGMSCPLPILKARKALSDMEPGHILKISSTDHGSVKDMQAFADQTGHTLLNSSEIDNVYIFYIRKH